MGTKQGRPTAYRAEFAEQARKLCLLGATDADMAEFFGVDERTVNRWKEAHSEFCQSIKAGKMQADSEVANRLYKRALGYKHNAVKILAVSGGTGLGSEVQQIPYIEHYPPDTAAAIFWLKNRRRDKWRDKQDVEHSGEVRTGVVVLPPLVSS